MPPSARMRTPWFCLTVGLLPLSGGMVIKSVPKLREGTSRSCLPLPMPLPPCPGDEVYSTIRKQEYNGKIPRFRRIQGEIELYTSDTVMQSESSSSWAGVDQSVNAHGSSWDPHVPWEVPQGRLGPQAS